MFQTSTNRQPLFVKATTAPTSHPTLHALATFAGTGIGPISSLPSIIDASQICLGPVRWIRKWPSSFLPDLTGPVSESQSYRSSRSFWLAGKSRAARPTMSRTDSSPLV